MLLCTLEVVEGRVCLLDVLEVLDAVEGAGGFPHASESSVGELLRATVPRRCGELREAWAPAADLVDPLNLLTVTPYFIVGATH